MSSPPLSFATSEPDANNADVDMQDAVRTPINPRRGRRPLFNDTTPSVRNGGSSPQLSGVAARRALGLPSVGRHNGSSVNGSPLQFPSSSPLRRTAAARQQTQDLHSPARNGERPLFLSPSPIQSTPRRARRGDIHSSAPVSSPSFGRGGRREVALGNGNANGHANGAPPSDVLNSEGGLNIPSSMPVLSAQAAASDIPDNGVVRVIWGTDVNLMDSMSIFTDFIQNFKAKYRRAYDREHGDPTAVAAFPEFNAEDGEKVVYEGYLRKMRLTSQTNLNLDALNLLAYPPSKKLFSQLVKYPQEIIPIMDQVLKDQMVQLAEEDQRDGMDGMEGEIGDEEINEIIGRVYKVRPFGIPCVNMRDLNPSDTDKLVSIKGLVIRATPIIPDMKSAFFRCLNCAHTVQVEIDRGRIDEPQRCPREQCGQLGSMSLIHNRSDFADRQVIRLQETPDAVPDGQTPHTVSLCVYDELVDLSKPGDRLTITGIFRAVPVRVNPRQRVIKSLFKTYLDVVHIKRGDGKRMGFDKSTRAGEGKAPGVGGGVGIGGEEEDVNTNLPEHDQPQRTRAEEMEDKLKELSHRQDLYELLARSLAPSIWEMDDVKKGILLQLFGGTNKSISKGGGGGGPRYRGDINVLLVGDPGTSKSQILQYVHKIAPRGVYTSGKGSSAVGLTAYVTRDPDSKQLVLESGALVLSDGGVCCIDEFDKMSDATRSVLHEVMEQQTVSIAKAGIITTLNARTSILAAANPVQSRYNVELPITRNIDLPPTLISRFDLLYLVLDKVDEDMDRRLAEHLVGLYLEDNPYTGGQDILPLDTLTAYISYARSKINPVISEEAANELVSSYVELRSMGEDPRSSERRITATTRQLESMIRLSEAHARMRFSETVQLQDVQEANRLMREAIRTSATDPKTGLIDLDMINTGHGQQERRMRADLKKEVLNLIESMGGAGGERGVKWNEALKQLNTQSDVHVDAAEFSEVIRSLDTEGLIKVVGERERRTIRRVRGGE